MIEAEFTCKCPGCGRMIIEGDGIGLVETPARGCDRRAYNPRMAHHSTPSQRATAVQIRSNDPAEMRGGSLTVSWVNALGALRAEPRDAVVYFARRGDFVKIGTTRRLRARLSALTAYRDPAGLVGPMDLLTTIPGGRVMEGVFHSRFEASSVDGYGEWFHADLDVLGFALRCMRIDQMSEEDVNRAARDTLLELRDGLLD